MEKAWAAHIKEDGEVQTILDHLLGTADLSKQHGQAFESGDLAYLIGLFHDIGKYSNRFQRRIYEGGNPVDHSTAGAVEINRLLPRLGFLLSYSIAGHHAGLPDGGSAIDPCDQSTLYGRLKRKLEPYTSYQTDLNSVSVHIDEQRLPIKPLGKIGFSVSFYIRMLFSCLVDGDFLDTENFMEKRGRGQFQSIETLNKMLDDYLAGKKFPHSEINKKRDNILNCCIAKAEAEKGLYTMTVPTGGGKTISSLAFALKHAQHHKMARVIYVIPYNSIIEQNAAVFKEILGEENVLEHHSNYNYDENAEDGEKEKIKLAAENWDMPVIVTTTVQFFESLFASKTFKCRKLHNIADAVIIFDEAQMLPLPYLIPCVRAISELVHNYRSSVVLCSATQPTLEKLFPRELKPKEICEDIGNMYRFFKRTRISYAGELGDEELANRLNAEKQVLCIVNTRQHAQNIFHLLKEDGCYHLSTLMYPRHRKQILEEIRTRLKEGLPCKVVSTSLIEAGVDVDFPKVYRAEAGLDSIIQAAGRCNREAKTKQGQVIVFKPPGEYRKHMPDMIRRPMEIANSIGNQFEDISSPEAISFFFDELYKVSGNGLDTKKIVEKFELGFERGLSFPFAEVAAEFRLIDNATRAIIIPRTERAEQLVVRLQQGERSRELLRDIQQYAVNVYDCNYNSLFGGGSILPLDDELAVLVDHSKYDDKTGLDASGDAGIGIFV